MDDLAEQLASWNHKQTAPLEEIHQAYQNYVSYPFMLLPIWEQDASCQNAVTWLLKHWVDEGNALDESVQKKLPKLLPAITTWEAQLHILQIYHVLQIGRDDYIILEDFARAGLKSPRKFVKAWAYEAMFQLTKFNPSLKIELKAICENAFLLEKGAVKVRIRKVLERLR